MRLPRFEYLKPASLEECLEALKEDGERAGILAGGTDLLVNMKQRVTCPDKIVSVRAIPELRSISEDKEGNMHIGACVPLTELVQNPLISEKLPALRDAVSSVASRHIRNMATLGGNICLATRCWYYNQSKLWRDSIEPCHRSGGSVCHDISGAKRCHAINNSDTAPILMALDAEVRIRNMDRERVIPVRDFFRDSGDRHTVLGSDELLTSVTIPESASSGPALFMKVSDRKGLDFATGSIASSIKRNGKQISGAVLVVNSIRSSPLILEKAAQTIMQNGLNDGAISDAAEIASSELGILGNLFTSAGYKRQIVGVLVKRALNILKTRAKEKGRANR
ncbi:FAD binding domain-containing protein [Thermodesulfobacteriota bacterium]